MLFMLVKFSRKKRKKKKCPNNFNYHTTKIKQFWGRGSKMDCSLKKKGVTKQKLHQAIFESLGKKF